MKTSIRLAALALAVAPLGAVAPVAAPAYAATDAAGTFIETLSGQAFAILKDKSMSRTAVRARFRQILRDNFALDEIGDKLIRRQRATITPAQYAAYKAVLPDYIINTYADRLYDYSNATLKVVRTLPRGANTDVMSRIQRPGSQPFDATWTVKTAARPQIVNLTVGGVNLALTQEADFTAYIQRNGFDRLVAFMKAGGKA